MDATVAECKRLVVQLDVKDCLGSDPCAAYLPEVEGGFLQAYGCTIEQAAGQQLRALILERPGDFAMGGAGLVSLVRPGSTAVAGPAPQG